MQLLGESAAGVGYLLKDRVMEPRGFADAVREVARGGSALDPEVVAQMLERRRPGGPIDTLTARECEVLSRMAEGQANRAIAVGLDLSDHTLARDLAGHLREARAAGRHRGSPPRARRPHLPARPGGVSAGYGWAHPACGHFEHADACGPHRAAGGPAGTLLLDPTTVSRRPQR